MTSEAGECSRQRDRRRRALDLAFIFTFVLLALRSLCGCVDEGPGLAAWAEIERVTILEKSCNEFVSQTNCFVYYRRESDPRIHASWVCCREIGCYTCYFDY